jgi:hypothetical protein
LTAIGLPSSAIWGSRFSESIPRFQGMGGRALPGTPLADPNPIQISQKSYNPSSGFRTVIFFTS